MPRRSLKELYISEFTGYTFNKFQNDLMAGLTVAAVALPLALAFGVAAGANSFCRVGNGSFGRIYHRSTFRSTFSNQRAYRSYECCADHSGPEIWDGRCLDGRVDVRFFPVSDRSIKAGTIYCFYSCTCDYRFYLRDRIDHFYWTDR